MLAGLWKRRCRSEDTRAGMALMQTGMLPAAQDVFLDAITKPWQENSASFLQPPYITSHCVWACTTAVASWQGAGKFEAESRRHSGGCDGPATADKLLTAAMSPDCESFETLARHGRAASSRKRDLLSRRSRAAGGAGQLAPAVRAHGDGAVPVGRHCRVCAAGRRLPAADGRPVATAQLGPP